MVSFITIVPVFLSFYVFSCKADCGQIFEQGVSDADKQIIVDIHNALRSQVSAGDVPNQPRPAMKLNNLEWDNGLADKAQSATNACEFRIVRADDDRFYVGQNLAEASATYKIPGANWKEYIQNWFSRHHYYTYPNSDYDGHEGAYTQIVWADTKYIGCGYRMYGGVGQYLKFFVCLYGPGGNLMGQPPYEV